MKIYKVGGYVRDKILGISAHDCDYVVVGGTTQEMLALGYKQVGRYFPVFLHPKTHEEYALVRSERKTGNKHQDFQVNSSPNISLVDDLSRRDITINAIAEDENGQLIDPYNGINDLKNKILRHISPAFSDDPLRILRVARFSAKLDFKVAPETIKLLQDMANKEEGLHISRERVVDELAKALIYKKRSNFFNVLLTSGNLLVFFPSFKSVISAGKFDELMNKLVNAADIKTRYSLLGVYLAPNTSNLHEYALKEKLIKHMFHSNMLYFNLNQQLTNDKLLHLLIKCGGFRNRQEFLDTLEAISNIFTDQQAQMALNNVQVLNKSLQIITSTPKSQLITKGMNTHDIISTIRNWQLAIIQKTKELLC